MIYIVISQNIKTEIAASAYNTIAINNRLTTTNCEKGAYMANGSMSNNDKNNNSIRHVGVIPDGIRRWSRKNNVPLPEAYLHGIKKLSKYTSMFFDSGVKVVSIFASSIQNFKRTQSEISAFCEAETVFCTNYLPQVAKQFGTKVVSVGRHDVLPSYFQDGLQKIENITINNSETKIYLLVAYDPIDEIVKALSLAKEPEDFPKFLLVPEPLDLVFRTSGANLLSNFLPLQSGLARLYIIKKLFNDTSPKDYQKILMEFKNLHRKYGE